MAKAGEQLKEDISDSGFDEYLNRPFEGLSSGEEDFQSQTGYSYSDLQAAMEGAKVQNFTTTIAFTSTDYRTVTWAAGTISYQDGLVTPEIATSNTGAMASRTYIYYDPQASKVALQTTTTATAATQGERLLLAIAVPNANTAGKAEIQTFGATGMYIENLSVEHLTSGSVRSKTVTLAVTAGTGDCYFNAGKTDFTNTQSGFILGIDDSDSDKAKFFIGDSSNYLNWTGSALNVAGAISGSTIDIGGADATSFHVDIDGNIWSGNAAFASAPFKVSSAGAATTSNLTVTGGSISGANITLGGAGDVSGTMELYDASSNLIIKADRLGHHYYDTSANELVKIDWVGFHAYDTSANELVKVDNAGFHGYLTAGTEQIRISGTGIEGYGTTGNTFNFYDAQGGTLYGQMGYYSTGSYFYFYSNQAAIKILASGQQLLLASSNADVSLSTTGGNTVTIGSTGTNAEIIIDSYDGSGGDAIYIDTTALRLGSPASYNTGYTGTVYLDVGQTKYIVFDRGIAVGALGF